MSRRAKLAGLALVVAVLLLLVPRDRDGPPPAEIRTVPAAAAAPMPATGAEISEPEAQGDHPSFLHGRVTTHGGAVLEGRLRWGGDEEAFWSDFFKGRKKENSWAGLVPPDQLPTERRAIRIFGREVGAWESPLNLDRPFMARFGDIARIDALGRDVVVTLRSGAEFILDGMSAGDFDDGVRIWDETEGVVDLGPRAIRSIDFLSGDGSGDAPDRLHGTVRTGQGAFTGFIHWDRDDGFASDELDGQDESGDVHLRFEDIRSITRRSPDSAVVTLLDGRELLMSGPGEIGAGNRGIHVGDARHGRVLISWDAFERVDFIPDGPSAVADDFPPGRPLSGSVTSRDGRVFTGRLVFDLDESDTAETLDAPAAGVDHSILFGQVASIVVHGSAAGDPTVTLRSGTVLAFERAGDLGDTNAGMLVFGRGQEQPTYLRWSDVARIDLQPQPLMQLTATPETARSP